ncbi:hypothetical protein C8J57DRAFT_1234174 [Mycena rebaudengoi]|nr:hypothetical protein C8J57DRAFT_1234174 [Mycena rebaudengoi]
MNERSHTRGIRNDSFRVKEKEASEASPSHGWETEKDVDVDVVGDGDGDADRADSVHAQQPQPQDTTCPLKMCRQWNGGGGGTERLPGRMYDGDKQEAQRTTDRDALRMAERQETQCQNSEFLVYPGFWSLTGGRHPKGFQNVKTSGYSIKLFKFRTYHPTVAVGGLWGD